MDKLSGSTDRVSSATSSLTSKMTSAFGNVKSSLTDLQGSIQTMATSLAGIAIGGTVSGLAWKQTAEYKLVNEQIERAITNNKKLGFSYKELEEFAKKQADAGEGTRQDTTKELYATIMAGQKYMKGDTGQEKLRKADAITDFWFSQKELMEQEGISSPEVLIQRATRTTGKMEGTFGARLMTAMGASESDMKSAKKRMELMVEQGSKVKMTKSDLTPEDIAAGVKSEMEKRPWEQLAVNISRLKNAIGDSIAGPMSKATDILAGFVELLLKIPGATTIIGLAGAGLALASAMSLVFGVMTPLYNVMKALNIITGIQTLLHASNASATVLDAGAHAMLTGAMEGEFAVTELTTVAQNVSLATRLRLVGAKIWDTAVTYANSAANFLGISSLLGLASAEGVATVGAYGLAAGIWTALSPLLPFVAAGALIVGVLALIAYKAGILSPIIEGLGNAFNNLKGGDIGGAWKSISNIKLPSFEEAKKTLTGEFNISYMMDKHFGIPLWTQIKYLEYIHDIMKRVREYIYNLWNTIINFWSWLMKALPGAEKSQAKSKVESQAAAEGINKTDIADWLRAKSPKSTSDIIGNVSYLLDGKRLSGNDLIKYMSDNSITGKSDTSAFFGNRVSLFQGSEKLQKLRETYENTPGFAEEIANAVSTALTGAFDKFIEVVTNLPDTITKAISGLVDTVFGTGTSEKLWNGVTDTLSTITETLDTTTKTINGMWTAISSISIPGVGSIGELLGILPAAESGGEVTNEGFAYVHKNEPIIPAKISQNSNLISLLESISIKGDNDNAPRSDINLTLNYYASAQSTGGLYLDKFSFERAVKEIIGKCTRQYGSY